LLVLAACGEGSLATELSPEQKEASFVEGALEGLTAEHMRLGENNEGGRAAELERFADAVEGIRKRNQGQARAALLGKVFDGLVAIVQKDAGGAKDKTQKTTGCSKGVVRKKNVNKAKQRPVGALHFGATMRLCSAKGCIHNVEDQAILKPYKGDLRNFQLALMDGKGEARDTPYPDEISDWPLNFNGAPALKSGDKLSFIGRNGAKTSGKCKTQAYCNTWLKCGRSRCYSGGFGVSERPGPEEVWTIQAKGKQKGHIIMSGSSVTIRNRSDQNLMGQSEFQIINDGAPAEGAKPINLSWCTKLETEALKLQGSSGVYRSLQASSLSQDRGEMVDATLRPTYTPTTDARWSYSRDMAFWTQRSGILSVCDKRYQYKHGAIPCYRMCGFWRSVCSHRRAGYWGSRSKTPKVECSTRKMIVGCKRVVCTKRSGKVTCGINKVIDNKFYERDANSNNAYSTRTSNSQWSTSCITPQSGSHPKYTGPIEEAVLM